MLYVKLEQCQQYKCTQQNCVSSVQMASFRVRKFNIVHG